MHLKMSVECRPSCPSLNMLNTDPNTTFPPVAVLSLISLAWTETHLTNNLNYRLSRPSWIFNSMLGTNVREIWFEEQNFPFLKMHLKMPSAKWRSFCPGRNELTIKSQYVQHMCALTHWNLNTMTAICKLHLKCISAKGCAFIFIIIPLEFVPKAPVDKKLVLVKVMTWRRIDDKSLPELIPISYASQGINGFIKISKHQAVGFRFRDTNCKYRYTCLGNQTKRITIYILWFILQI